MTGFREVPRCFPRVSQWHSACSTRGTMSRTVLALVLVAASATVASAGTFVGLGLGTAVSTTGDTPYGGNGRSGRLEIGQRFSHLSIEGMASRADVSWDAGHADAQPYTWTFLALAGKYNFVLQDKFEAFVRAGLQHTSFDQQNA